MSVNLLPNFNANGWVTDNPWGYLLNESNVVEETVKKINSAFTIRIDPTSINSAFDYWILPVTEGKEYLLQVDVQADGVSQETYTGGGRIGADFYGADNRPVVDGNGDNRGATGNYVLYGQSGVSAIKFTVPVGVGITQIVIWAQNWLYVPDNPQRQYPNGAYPVRFANPSFKLYTEGQKITIPSEIKGVFVKWMDAGMTWETHATAYQPYGVNWLVGEALGTYFSRSNLDTINIHNNTYDYIGEGIKAAHNHGMKFTAMMLMQFVGGEVTPDASLHAIDENGILVRWVCPVKGHDLMVAICQEVATKYPDLDGFMFDYIRYQGAVCYCEQCHQRFVTDTGLTDTVWRTDVVSGGKYYMQFLEWRVRPITEIVRDVHDAMLAINPKLEFAIAALALWYENGVGYGFPIRQWFGQDTADMVSKGYIDVVCPMQYTADLALLQGIIDTNQKYLAGGVEGKIPFVTLIGGMEDSTADITPAQLASVVNICRQMGTDGFLIYRGIPNFANEYLSQIPVKSDFTITSLAVQQGTGIITVTWTTSSPASSVVEYSNSPLFYTQELYWGNGFKYYQVTHSLNTAKVESPTLATTHSLNVVSDGVTPMYLRVQSADANGTLSSKEMLYTPIPSTSWALDISASTGGTVNPSGLITLSETQSAVVQATPNSGYALHHWVFDTGELPASPQITIPPQQIGTTHTLQAVFAPSPMPNLVPAIALLAVGVALALD